MDDSRQIQVIATTAEGTRSALEGAKRLSMSAGTASIVVLVPHLMSAANPLDGPRETARVTEQYRDFAQSAGVDATIRLCVCRRHQDVFQWMLGRLSLIVIGGRRRWWWPTSAQRIARDLKRAGHSVVFAEVR